jgi:hypothetical protein
VAPIVVIPAEEALAEPIDVPVTSVAPVMTEPPLVISEPAIAAHPAELGLGIGPAYWADPLGYEPPAFVASSLAQSFRPVDPRSAPLMGTLPSPIRISLPAIGVDSSVAGLKVMELGDSRAYETPKNLVGHIPVSANPGERGGSWYFGHLESPIAREGNVFYNLPDIPQQLRQGDDVYAIVDNGQASFLYRITESFVVHQDQLRMDYGYLQGLKPEYALLDPTGPNIHLVTCVPRWSYDYRLVVSGTLVGQR